MVLRTMLWGRFPSICVTKHHLRLNVISSGRTGSRISVAGPNYSIEYRNVIKNRFDCFMICLHSAQSAITFGWIMI